MFDAHGNIAKMNNAKSVIGSYFQKLLFWGLEKIQKIHKVDSP